MYPTKDHHGTSPIAQQAKNLPAMQEIQEMWVQFLVQKDPREEGVATHSSILCLKNSMDRAFPGGSVIKNPSANAEDTGLIPGPGRFHMLRST